MAVEGLEIDELPLSEVVPESSAVGVAARESEELFTTEAEGEALNDGVPVAGAD